MGRTKQGLTCPHCGGARLTISPGGRNLICVRCGRVLLPILEKLTRRCFEELMATFIPNK